MIILMTFLHKKSFRSLHFLKFFEANQNFLLKIPIKWRDTHIIAFLSHDFPKNFKFPVFFNVKILKNSGFSLSFFCLDKYVPIVHLSKTKKFIDKLESLCSMAVRTHKLYTLLYHVETA